jgi:hypothetical protein
LEFYIKHEVTGFATAGQTGKVIMAVDFDASDAPPTLKQHLEDTIPHVDAMPCDDLHLPLLAKQLHSLFPTLYVRPGGLPGASDIKTYDAGNLNVATQGLNSNGATLGELRVRYTVTLSVPILESSTAVPANNSVVNFQTAAGGEAGGATTVAYTLLMTKATGSLGAVNTAGSIVLPPGNYMYSWRLLNIFTGSATQVYAGLYKGGVLIPVIAPEIAFTAASQTINELSDSGFFTSDGTAASALTLQSSNTYSTGSNTVYGSLTVLAV